MHARTAEVVTAAYGICTMPGRLTRGYARSAPAPCRNASLEVFDRPVMPPARPPHELLTAAFARTADARYAMGILETCGDAPVRATLEPILDDRGEIQLVMLHIEIDGIARDRVLAAISGGHGVAMSQPDDGLSSGSAARIA